VSGNALRPGDVVTTRAGLSVEIDNTDAEGRLVLCDALAYGAEQKPELIIDFATLTGAARVALGPDLPALFASDDSMAGAVLSAGHSVSDPPWPTSSTAPPRATPVRSPLRCICSGSCLTSCRGCTWTPTPGTMPIAPAVRAAAKRWACVRCSRSCSNATRAEVCRSHDFWRYRVVTGRGMLLAHPAGSHACTVV
jgi:hypothetical protein